MAAEGRWHSSFVWCFSPIFSFENGRNRFTPKCFLDTFLMNSYLHDKEVQQCGQCVFLLHFTFLMGGILFISFDCDSLLNMFFKCFIVLFTFRSFILSYLLCVLFSACPVSGLLPIFPWFPECVNLLFTEFSRVYFLHSVPYQYVFV